MGIAMIAVMAVVMGAMFLGGHKMMGGHSHENAAAGSQIGVTHSTSTVQASTMTTQAGTPTEHQH